MRILRCLLIVFTLSFTLQGQMPQVQHAQVSVAVMPFLSSALDPVSNLTALALRDSVMQRLAEDPSIRVVIRRRAYALSLDAEIVIAEPNSAFYKTPSDYVIFGHLVPAETGERANVDMIMALFEVKSGELVVLEKINSDSDHPLALADTFYKHVRDHLVATPARSQPGNPSITRGAPNKLAILPIWVLGHDDYDMDSTTARIVKEVRDSLSNQWPSSTIADSNEVLDILEAHGLNQFGGRADAYAESVAKVIGADEVLLIHLNNYAAEGGTHWSLGMTAIDIDSGVIIRVKEATFYTLPDLLRNVSELAIEFAQAPYEIPLVNAPNYKRYVHLSEEGKLYFRIATERDWADMQAPELSTELRVQIAETALSCIPEMEDGAFLELMQKSFELAYGTPQKIDLYNRYAKPRTPSSLLNANADFMHLALNARRWENPENALLGECLRVEILTRMNQPEEASIYLREIDSNVANYSFLKGEIAMLEGRYPEALKLFEQSPNDSAIFFERKAQAAFGAKEFKKEYAALKEHAIREKFISHLATGQRMLFLMNTYESPSNRLKLIDQYASEWARGSDVAQFTIARAELEQDKTEPALSILRALSQKQYFTGILRYHEASTRQYMQTQFENQVSRQAQQVTYAEVNVPPSHFKYYVQPIGYTDLETLKMAIERAEAFSEFDFVLLPNIQLPLHPDIYNVETRQFYAYEVQNWACAHIEMPADTLHYTFVLDQEIRGDAGWIYANTHWFGQTIVSDYRWRLYYPQMGKYQMSRGIANSLLSVIQRPMQGWLGSDKIKAITGSSQWPNHAGTIQYSKGTAEEAFEAPFHICASTQKLYAAIDWYALQEYRKMQYDRFKSWNQDTIDFYMQMVPGPQQP